MIRTPPEYPPTLLPTLNFAEGYKPMALDPTKHADWEIAEEAESRMKTVKKAGINPVVCINAFLTDTGNEIKAVRRICEAAGGHQPDAGHCI